MDVTALKNYHLLTIAHLPTYRSLIETLVVPFYIQMDEYEKKLDEIIRTTQPGVTTIIYRSNTYVVYDEKGKPLPAKKLGVMTKELKGPFVEYVDFRDWLHDFKFQRLATLFSDMRFSHIPVVSLVEFIPDPLQEKFITEVSGTLLGISNVVDLDDYLMEYAESFKVLSVEDGKALILKNHKDTIDKISQSALTYLLFT